MPNLDAPSAMRARAVELVQTHRARLARAIARQIQVTVTRYADMDMRPVSKNCEALLQAVEPMVLHADARKLTAMAKDVVALRSAAGFQASDFIVAAMCFLPVLRRFYAQIENDATLAMELYEEYESVCLPFMGELMGMLDDGDLEMTSPDGRRTKAIFEQLSELSQREGGFPRISIMTMEEADTDPSYTPRKLPFSVR